MSDDRPIRVGIIGAGNIADSHLDGYLRAGAAAEVTAIADIDGARATALAARAGGGASVFADYRELLGSGLVDAVDVCLPHHLHADAIVAAAEAGRLNRAVLRRRRGGQPVERRHDPVPSTTWR